MNLSSPAFDDAHLLKCELATEVLRSSGALRLQVTGWSMLPVIFPGDTLVIERATGDAIREGDLVLFSRDRRLFAHRVVATSPELRTRGDSMAEPDPPVSQGDLLGRIAAIERNGKRIEPGREPRLAQRAIAALVRRSEMAARVLVTAHGLQRST